MHIEKHFKKAEKHSRHIEKHSSMCKSVLLINPVPTTIRSGQVLVSNVSNDEIQQLVSFDTLFAKNFKPWQSTLR